MNFRKNLGIIGGILTLVSTYFLTFYKSGFAYASGYGTIIRIFLMLRDAPLYGSQFGIPSFLVYLIAIVLIIFLLSGIFQLLLGENRELALTGSIFTIFGAILLFISHIGFSVYELMFIWDPFYPGIFPFHVEIATYSLGIYVLLIGGILTLIGFILTRKKDLNK